MTHILHPDGAVGAGLLTDRHIDRVLQQAFEEDAPFGDLTAEAFIPSAAVAEAALVAREPGVFSGGRVFHRAMTALSSAVVVEDVVSDGESFSAGDTLARINGPAQAVLTAERIALNLVQRMGGIATVTARFVTEVAGTGARIVDTRKTTPGLRALERYAVRCGGGHNHRFSLSDAVMAKDNHLALVGDLAEAIRQARRRLPHTVHIEVEVDRMNQIPGALEGGADTIMLDNFTVSQLREGVEMIGGRAVVEASGNVTVDTVAQIARTGVDVISVGALTHSVKSLDLGLDISVNQ